MSFKVTTNLPQVQVAINKSLMAKKKGVERSADTYLKKVETDAKKNISTNRSIFRGKMISSFKRIKSKTSQTLYVDSDYAPFIEFGTKKNFKLEYPELAGFARNFKGKKTESNLKDIEDWAASKGISRKDTFKIVKKLLKEGNKAHPFFYRAVYDNLVFLRRSIKASIRRKR